MQQRLLLLSKTFRHSIYVLLIVVLYCFVNLALKLVISTLIDTRNWRQWCYSVRTVNETLTPVLWRHHLCVICNAFSSQLLLLGLHGRQWSTLYHCTDYSRVHCTTAWTTVSTLPQHRLQWSTLCHCTDYSRVHCTTASTVLPVTCRRKVILFFGVFPSDLCGTGMSKIGMY